MRVGICAVGAELLSGAVQDTNTAWLARRLLESGATITGAMVIGDDRDELVAALRWLADRSELLVVGGGLGPTADDVTRDAVAQLAGVELRRRPELVDHLDTVYARLERVMPPEALRQAEVPEAASVHPPLGTAAGFALDVDHDGRNLRLHVLPGVPWEYRGTADAHVLPEVVRAAGGAATITRTVHVAGLGESGVGAQLGGLAARLEAARRDPDDPEHGLELGFLATSDEVLVKVQARGPSPAAARERSEPVVDEVVGLLGAAVTSVDDVTLEQTVARSLTALGRTVATVETLTGGRLAASLASVPGCAAYLAAGVVAYDAEVVGELLGDDRDLVATHGLVSAEVAGALARAARRRFGTDLAIATTGRTEDDGGDGAAGDAEVGDAVWAIATADGAVHAERRHIPASDRDILQVRGAAFALESLRRHLVTLEDADATAAGITP